LALDNLSENRRTEQAAAVCCPRCDNAFLQRARQDGPVDRLLEFFFVYPFLCQICRHRFSALRWGIRYNGTLDDRRRYVRHPVRLPVTLTSQSGKHDGRATDLSVGGCSIAVFAPYREGDVLSIWLQTPDDEPPIEVDAAVVRTVSQGRLGVEFVSLRDPEEARLRRLALTLWTESTLTARKRR
jgi:hypothetical protein